MTVIVNFWATIPSKLYRPSSGFYQEHMSQKELQNETVSEKMDRKRKILERGCSMIAILYEMSQNGTSYETLLAWHARIHDLEYPLRQVFKMIFVCGNVHHWYQFRFFQWIFHLQTHFWILSGPDKNQTRVWTGSGLGLDKFRFKFWNKKMKILKIEKLKIFEIFSFFKIFNFLFSILFELGPELVQTEVW